MTKILEEHFGYLSDRVKIERYQAAIESLVQPEHCVLDLGCGSGLLGLMALRAGARRVLFVEEGAVIEVARQTIENAGFSDKADFFQANSFELQLPEKVDIVVCDHVGYFGFDYGLLELLADARKRFLKPDGKIVPGHIDLRLAPVESKPCAELVGQWSDGSVPDDFSWLKTSAANSKHAMNLEADDLLAAEANLASLELGTDIAPFLSWSVEFTCTRDAALSGILGWFSCCLWDDISMTNSPLAIDSLGRPQAYLPLDETVEMRKGERINVTLMVRHVDSIIAWIVELPDSGKRFANTTFNSILLDKEALTRSQADKVASLNHRGRAHQIVLSYCDGQRSIADVQEMVKRENPELFPTKQATDAFVSRVLTWEVEN